MASGNGIGHVNITTPRLAGASAIVARIRLPSKVMEGESTGALYCGWNAGELARFRCLATQAARPHYSTGELGALIVDRWC